jgi:uncharacterized membrane protein
MKFMLGYRKLIAFVTLVICITIISLNEIITGDAALNAIVDMFMVFVGGNIGERGIETYKSLKKDAQNNSI